MHISVKILRRKYLPLVLTEDNTIKDIKSRIEDAENIKITQQSLFYDGKPLENERTLQDYMITKDSTLYLYLRGNTIS